MPAEDLTHLATIGGQSLVEIMAASRWPSIRDNALSLFLSSDPREHAFIEYQLDRDAATLQAVTPDARGKLRADLAVVWRRQLIQLLAQRPAAADDLRRLIDQIREALPQVQRQRSHKQRNIARDHGTVFAVQDGSLHYHPLGSPPESAADDADGTA